MKKLARRLYQFFYIDSATTVAQSSASDHRCSRKDPTGRKVNRFSSPSYIQASGPELGTIYIVYSHKSSAKMAEIGLAASILSVAAFGVSVATTLYETADIMNTANQQIRALAKHVTQFTAVLNHMGQVLKTEKSNCSKEVLRDIRKIKHSCKRTFREIRSTVKAKRFRRFVWLFKRTKAMELEARLDSQQSMLQCMIHTLTVSKLSHMDSRYARA